MPYLPDLPEVQGSHNPAAPSLAGASAAGRAMMGAGKDISGVGDQLGAYQQHRQQIADNDAEVEAALEMQKAYADHELFREKNPDESMWKPDIDQRTKAVQVSLMKKVLSPEARKRLDARFKSWQQEKNSSTEMDAARQQSARARTNATRLREEYIRAGKFDDADAVIRNSPAFHEEEKQVDLMESARLRKSWDDQKAYEADLAVIDQNPRQWRLDHRKPKEGEDPAVFARKDAYARQQASIEQQDTIQSVREGMLSQGGRPPKILKSEDIDAYTEDASPIVREMLKRELREMNDAQAIAEKRTPENQQKTVGKVMAMLRDYTPEKDEWDEQAVRMESLIRDLPEGAARDEVQRLLNARRKGETQSLTKADAGGKALDEYFTNGPGGKLPQSQIMLTADAVEAGFLNDPTKLKSLGFSKDQISLITKETTNDKRLKVFREQWESRGKADENVSQTVWQTAMAIRTGANQVMDPEAEDAMISARIKRELNHGKARIEYAEWIKLNPNATSQEIEDKIFALGGEEARNNVRSGKYDPKPTRTGPNGADDSTSSLPVGKDLTEIVKNFEAGGADGGFHKEAYWDYGQWSIGYGTKSKEGETITQKEAESRLATELGSHRKRVESAASQAGLTFTAPELDALTSFDFNTGSIETLLAGGKRTKQQIADMMLYYRNAGGERLRGLENRRRAERHLFLHGHANAQRNTGELSDYNVITQ